MKQSKIDDLVCTLSSEYDSDLPMIRGSTPRRMMDTSSLSLATPSIHLIHEPNFSCSLPCLALGDQSRRPQFEYSYASDEDVKNEHLYFKQLLSRHVRFSKPEHASTTILKNIIASFGQILDFELQRRLHNMGERLDRAQESGKLIQMKDEILDKFEELSLLDERRKPQSPALPVYARTNFSTVTSATTPVKDGEQQNHEGGTHNHEGGTEILFDAEICVYIIPDNTWLESHLRTKGKVLCGRDHHHPHHHCGSMEELNLSLDMDVLYESIRKETRYISKQIIKALVGKDIFRSKSKSRRRNDGHSNSHASTGKKQHRKTNSDADQTQPTIEFIDDGSSMTTSLDSPYKFGVPRMGGMTTTATNTNNDINNVSTPPMANIKQASKTPRLPQPANTRHLSYRNEMESSKSFKKKKSRRWRTLLLTPKGR